MNSVVVSSFNYQLLREIRNISDKIYLMILCDAADVNVDIVKLVQAINAFAYGPRVKFVNRKLVEKLHRAGIMIMPWCDKNENNEETMKKMLNLGVDGFFADDPALLKSLLKQRAEAKVKAQQKRPKKKK